MWLVLKVCVNFVENILLLKLAKGFQVAFGVFGIINLVHGFRYGKYSMK